MKFCPVCRRKYDNAQNFCLDDGTALEVFVAEEQVATFSFKDDVVVNQTSPTVLSPKQTPLPNQNTITDLFSQPVLPHSVSPQKSNSLQKTLLRILGTLGVVSIVGGGIWWLANRQTTNEISSNPSANSTQKTAPDSKTNYSHRLPASNQLEKAKSDKKSANGSNANQIVSGNSQTENTSKNSAVNSAVNSSTAPAESSTVELQVKFTTLGKNGNYPISGGSITIQANGKILSASTNSAGIAYFKGVLCNKPVKIRVSNEDGSGNFTRNPKCGATAFWGYQTDCFVSGKNVGCAVEQVK